MHNPCVSSNIFISYGPNISKHSWDITLTPILVLRSYDIESQGSAQPIEIQVKALIENQASTTQPTNNCQLIAKHQHKDWGLLRC